MEIPKLITQPIPDNPEKIKRMIDDLKKMAMAILGDHGVLIREKEMKQDLKELDLRREDVPSIDHPLFPLSDEIDQNLSTAAIVRDTIRACLEKLKSLDPDAAELQDETLQAIVNEPTAKETSSLTDYLTA